MKLQEQMDKFDALKTEIWAVSPDKAESLEKMRSDEKLSIPLLLDSDLKITDSFGLKNTKGNLPDPAALVIDSDGTISYLRIDEDYTKRPDNSEILDALSASK